MTSAWCHVEYMQCLVGKVRACRKCIRWLFQNIRLLCTDHHRKQHCCRGCTCILSYLYCNHQSGSCLAHNYCSHILRIGGLSFLLVPRIRTGLMDCKMCSCISGKQLSSRILAPTNIPPDQLPIHRLRMMDSNYNLTLGYLYHSILLRVHERRR